MAIFEVPFAKSCSQLIMFSDDAHCIVGSDHDEHRIIIGLHNLDLVGKRLPDGREFRSRCWVRWTEHCADSAPPSGKIRLFACEFKEAPGDKWRCSRSRESEHSRSRNTADMAESRVEVDFAIFLCVGCCSGGVWCVYRRDRAEQYHCRVPRRTGIERENRKRRKRGVVSWPL